MAFADKYTASFKDFSGDIVTIQIQEDGSVSSEEMQLMDEPLIISCPEKDLDKQIWGMGCKIFVRHADNLSTFDDLFGTAERDHKVIIRKGPAATPEGDRTLIFEGFVIPEVYSQMMMPVKHITIPANNQLSGLKDYYSDLLADTSNFSTVPVIDLVHDILDSTGLDLPVYIKNTLFSTLYRATYDIDADGTCYEKLRINRQIYIDQDEIMDGYSILEDILKITYSRLYYMDGKWVIDRFTDMANTDWYRTYPHPYVFGTRSKLEVTHKGFDLKDESMVANSGTLDYQSGKKLYKMIIDFDRYDNLVDSSFINILANVTVPDFPEPTIGLWRTWTGADLVNKSYSSINVVSGIQYEEGSISSAQFKYIPITASFIVDFDDRFIMLFSYIYDDFRSSAWPATFRGGFRLRYWAGTAWRFIEYDKETQVYSSFVTTNDYTRSRGFVTEQEISDTSADGRQIKISEEVAVQDIRIIVEDDYTAPEQIEFFIDILPAEKWADPNWVTQAIQKVGDVVIEQNSEVSSNVFEGVLNTDFRGDLVRRLRIYDGDYVNYKNTLLLTDNSTPEKVVRSKDWKDNNLKINEIKLQEALIHDLAQQYNTARHSIKVDLWLNKQSNTFVSMGSIFTYSTQLATKNFIVMGYDYNVKMNAYRIALREYKDYDNFNIV